MSKGPARLAGIVLAAGAGRRFGGPKQLARFRGEPLVVRAARLATGVCTAGVAVVTGAFAAEVASALTGLPVQIRHNAAWQSGMSSSIRVGLDAWDGACTACLLMLADQPLVDEPALRFMVQAWQAAPGRVVAAVYSGVRGVPAIFPESAWEQLRLLEGDRGARALLATLPDVITVPMPAAAFDIDEPGDLAGLPPG